MKPAELREVANVCHMLGDSIRLSLVVILAKGPKPVMALCAALKMSQPTLSYHLSLLRMARMVDWKRKGRQMLYSLNRERLGVVREFLAKIT